MNQDPAVRPSVEDPIKAGTNVQTDRFSPLVTTEGALYEIPAEGSLGLLAMGYVGIMLWREKRYEESLKPKPEV